jgi:hypothetical protein
VNVKIVASRNAGTATIVFLRAGCPATILVIPSVGRILEDIIVFSLGWPIRNYYPTCLGLEATLP